MEKIRERYERGDTLYGRHVVEVLLLEVEALAERCRLLSNPQPITRVAPAERCEKWAQKGTGQGTCDAPLSYAGYCPRWRSHLEED